MARKEGSFTKRRSSFGERIEARLIILGMTQADLVRKSGLPQGYLGQIRAGDIQNIFMDKLFILADALECDARWLALGEGSADKK